MRAKGGQASRQESKQRGDTAAKQREESQAAAVFAAASIRAEHNLSVEERK
jgi:hypothetical protein